MKYEKESWIALELASRAGSMIKAYYVEGIGHEMKEDDTPVTIADRESNRIILEGLVSGFPDDCIVSEELGVREGVGSRVWYVDPLDGTKSFVQRADTFAVHIGLAYDGKPVFGVVHKPLTGESYLGIIDEGAWRVLPDGRMKDAMIHGELPGFVPVLEKKRSDYEGKRLMFERLDATGFLFSGSEGLRAMKIVDGLAHVRIGNSAAHPWDICAPHAVLEAAGGVCAYADNSRPIRYSGQSMMDDKVIFARDRKTMDLVWNVLQYFKN
jgi:3'(2'), 5'-bisphosphate nucleotidase